MFNGGLIKPAGYSASYAVFSPIGCNLHDAYAIGCSLCYYREDTVTVSLGNDILALIIDREDGSLIDYVTADTYWETAANLSHSGTVVISETAWDMEDKPKALIALMEEAELYSDCFQ